MPSRKRIFAVAAFSLAIGFAGPHVSASETASEEAPARRDNSTRRAKRISNGSRAPDFDVAVWSDGKARKLSDFRGKVVVLHFWGTWCGPCVETIPLWKQLERDYRDKGVVFIGIHTAGAELKPVQEFMSKHDWDHLTAIDRGDSKPESATFRRYGIPAVNQVVVIDREGIVAYNGGKPTQFDEPAPQLLKRLAKELGVRSPTDDDATYDEQREGAIKIFSFLYGREIDAALGNK